MTYSSFPARIATLWLIYLSILLNSSLSIADPNAPQENPSSVDMGLPIELGGQRTLPFSEEELNRERWLNIVQSHTGQYVGLYEPIKVKFNQNYVSQEALSTTPAPELFVLTPQTKGYTYWSAPDELSFKPLAGWAEKTSYQVAMIPHPSLGEMPKEITPLNFTFITVEPSIHLSPLELTLTPDGKEAHIQAKVTLSEQVNLSQASQLIKAKQDHQPSQVQWRRGADGRTWQISLVTARFEEPSTLTLMINGKAIHSSLKQQLTLTIPRTGVFEVTRVYAIANTTKTTTSQISIEFSEPLNPKQNLEGMVTSAQGTFKADIQEGRLTLTSSQSLSGPVTLNIAPGLTSISGQKIHSAQTQHVTFKQVTPKVRAVAQGAILPNVAQPLFAFESIGLKSVEITALVVKEKNLGQFLQNNQLTGRRNMTHVGRYIWRKRVPLNLTAQQLSQWHRHHLDLSPLLKEAPHGLLHLEVTFDRRDASIVCQAEDRKEPLLKRQKIQNQEEQSFDEPSSWDGSYWWNEPYEDRQNPCKNAYYRRDREGHTITQNILSSNLGIIAKKGAGAERFFAVTDLLTAQPISGAKVSLYNYQNDLLSTGITNQEGFVYIPEPQSVYYARVDDHQGFGVLKLDQLSKLATTHFDVGGDMRDQGINGTIYAERGMWRPGDDIYLTFVLQDAKQVLPKGHPIFVTFYTPEQNQESHFILRQGINGFYPFSLKTEEGASTGKWEVKVEVGGEVFTKTLSIETFEPNRLQVNLRLPKTHFLEQDFPVHLSVFSQWLHGAKAKELPTKVKLALSKGRTAFSTAQEFNFNDITLGFNQSPEVIYEGKLDANGDAYFTWEKGSELPLGKINARFTTMVSDPSGASSFEYRNASISSGKRFVGVRLPKGDKRGMLLTDKPHQVLIKTVDGNGQLIDGAPLEIKLYKIEWKWWWDQSSENLISVEKERYSKLLQTAEVSTQGGNAQWDLEVKSPIWGRFLLKVCETPHGHCSAQTLYIDWPGWANETGEKSIGATYLPMSLDNTRYVVGQEAKLKLPIMPQGRALISIESGAHLISQRWVELGETETEVSIPITEGMAPNVYVNVTAIQPHARSNDRPIRLYTVLPMIVDDPKTHLKPQLELPQEVRPESEILVKVTETQGKPMTYTLALVDEGLLGVTAFQTPDLHHTFFRRLALGVKTWDLYDDVIGAYGGVVERLLSIGGSESTDEEEDKRRRFEPIVLYQGPFELKAGEVAQHRFTLPQYVGAVRAMLVAGHQEGEHFAYGSAAQKVIVRQALMLLPNLPRSVGPEEDLTLPISVFATSPELQTVELFSRSSDEESYISPRVVVQFDQPKEQEQLARVQFKVGSKIGMQSLYFNAEAGTWDAHQKVNLPVKFNNPPSHVTSSIELTPREIKRISIQDFGIEGSRSGVLEASKIPDLKISNHLEYLLSYPHGCAEQTTSKAFPQLYLSSLTRLSSDQKSQVQNHVEKAIRRLKSMQTSQGDFAYWPGGDANLWVSSYVGHFLLEADAQGYQVPQGMLNAWKTRQIERAQEWVSSTLSTDQEEQAYRLFTLALAKASQLGAMNRLRQGGKLSAVAQGLLARAYAWSGQKEAAQALLNTPVQNHDETSENIMKSFKSPTRDLALQLEVYVTLEDQEKIDQLSQELMKQLKQLEGGHTHELATALNALGVWARKVKTDSSYGIDYLFRQDGEDLDPSKIKYLYGSGLTLQYQLDTKDLNAKELIVKNDSPQKVYLTLNRKGIPRAGEEQTHASGIELNVEFLDEQGVKLTPEEVQQGQNLIARISVKNTTRQDPGQLALIYGVPSGWRIENDRLVGRTAKQGELIYQDIQDDQVKLYFELKSQQKWQHDIYLTAAFEGRFYHPATYVEAMYRPYHFALQKGFWTQVKR